VSQTAGAYPEPGEMLGPYRIVRRLGFGGMGVVFEAIEGTLNRSVALKVISPHLAHDAGFRARFVREAQAQASVRSPHVVTVFAHGEEGGRLYITTELVDAGDLGRLVQEHGAPPLATALDIIAQVASGLADAHDAGLVHRDIKPANVLLRRRDHGVQAYLADFGIARMVGAETGLTMVGGTVGTPSYMAPELHTGGQAGVESDIYSLGCLLWAAITGTAPYAGTTDYQIVSAHLEQPVPQLRPGTPVADMVNQVLLRSLAKVPAERYAGAAAMSRDLRAAALLAEQSGEAAVPAPGSVATSPPVTRPGAHAADRRPTPTPSPVPPPAHPPTPTPTPAPTPTPVPHARGRRRRIALVVAGAVLVVAAGVGAALALTAGDEPSGSTEPEPSSTAPTSPSTSPTPAPADEKLAVASLTQALVEQRMISEDLSECVAQGWIDGVGLDTLVEAGFFDEDMNYVDQPQESITQEMRDMLAQAIADCSLSG
jgi:serine/threonine protein kinase